MSICKVAFLGGLSPPIIRVFVKHYYKINQKWMNPLSIKNVIRVLF